jgi:hypothetical protein
MRETIVAENSAYSARPLGTPGAWVIYDDKEHVGEIRNGKFETFRPLSINEMLTAINLMLHAQHIDRNEEKVLKTKNEENGA